MPSHLVCRSSCRVSSCWLCFSFFLNQLVDQALEHRQQRYLSRQQAMEGVVADIFNCIGKTYACVVRDRNQPG